MRAPWLSLPVSPVSSVFAPFLLPQALDTLEVLREKGPRFTFSERGSKPPANRNAKPNRD